MDSPPPTTEIIWLNGALKKPEEAVIPVSDFGLLYGEGLMETMRARCGTIAYLGRHLSRLKRSAEWLSLSLPDESDIRRGLSKVLNTAGEGEWRMRLTVTRGSAGPMDAPLTVPPTLLVTLRPLPPAKQRWKAIWSSHRREASNPIYQIKSTSYLANLLARREAKVQDCDESIYLNSNNEVTEGAMTNVFIRQGTRLITPPVDAGLLPGVMRSALLDRAHEIGLTSEEKPFKPEAVYEADEAYLTNAIIGVVALAKVGDHQFSQTSEYLPLLRGVLWKPNDFVTP